jgi:hypothetical protein
VPLQRKLIQIEDVVASGRRYIDVGWPTFAWLPYFAQRYGASFAFAHVVRNPFSTAASLLTHGFFNGRNDAYFRAAILRATDAGVAHAEFADRYESFSAFEKCLFHWLEVNTFIFKYSQSPAFLGLYRFEDLYGEDGDSSEALISALLARPIADIAERKVDRHQHALSGKIEMRDRGLVDAVRDLSLRLGYSEEFLDRVSDAGDLKERYSAPRAL